MNDLEYYSSLFEYDAQTGELHWRVSRCNRIQVGQVAGTFTNGYIAVNVDGRKLYAHRIVWLLCKGEWPTQYLDHINGNRADNRIENLRDVSLSINQKNTRKARNPDRYIHRLPSGGYTVTLVLPVSRTWEEAKAKQQQMLEVLTACGLLPNMEEYNVQCDDRQHSVAY